MVGLGGKPHPEWCLARQNRAEHRKPYIIKRSPYQFCLYFRGGGVAD
jgi:hypothetical protein